MSPIAGKQLGKIPILVSIQGLFYTCLKPRGRVLVNVQGNKMYVNPQDTGVAPYLLQWGVYEKDETALFKRIVKKNMTVADIGANIGYYTLLAARLVGDGGQVFAFEPDANNFQLLCENLALNKCQNVVAVQKAVSNKSGKAKLFLDKTNLGGHSLTQANVKKKAAAVVETVSLDDFFREEQRKIDVIKMDIQGAEMDALQGMTDTLNKNQELLIFTEFWPSGLRNAGYSPEEFLERLTELGFDLYKIGQSLQRLDAGRLLKNVRGNEPAALLCSRNKRRK